MQANNEHSLHADGAPQMATLSAQSPFHLWGLIVPDNQPPARCLSIVERQICSLDHEVGVILYPNGKELCRAQGHQTGVSFTSEQRILARDGFVTHNHPGGSFFSYTDICFAHENNVAQLRAAARRNGPNGLVAHVHILDRPATGWYLEGCQYLNKLAQNQLLIDCGVAGVNQLLWTAQQRIDVQSGRARIGQYLIKELNLSTSCLPLYESVNRN
jgi:hypothetical protein